MRRVLIITRHNSYRTAAFVEAAQRLRTHLVLAADGPVGVIAGARQDGILIDMNDIPKAARYLKDVLSACPPNAVLATDDSTTELAAEVAAAFGHASNTPDAVRAARRKDITRQRLLEAGLRCPAFTPIALDKPIAAQIDVVRYPCVIKPVSLSASRGVIRADSAQELYSAAQRLREILARETIGETMNMALVEDFIAGFEVALEGVVDAGSLHVLTIFDKPDPLNGPYFEETYYITPSRLDAGVQTMIGQLVENACKALGLRSGPIHAECRINADGVWLLEIAPRTIGGDCGRLFQMLMGLSLEELVLRHAIGDHLDRRESSCAAGVLMIPVREGGILRRVEGVSEAGQVAFVEDLVINAREGQALTPWPEGCAYPGFIFAKAPAPKLVEEALRRANSCLRFVVAPQLPVTTVPVTAGLPTVSDSH